MDQVTGQALAVFRRIAEREGRSISDRSNANAIAS